MQNEIRTQGFPAKNGIFVADSISGGYRLLETKDYSLPLTGAVLLNNVTGLSTSNTYDISAYNEIGVFVETSGASVNLSGVIQTQAPSNNWVNLDNRAYSSADNTIFSFNGAYNNIRAINTGTLLSGAITVSFYARKS